MTVAVIGVGNRDRGDDGAGPAVADRVRARVGGAAEVLAGLLDPGELIDAWSGVDAAVVVDALAPRGSPGTLRRFDAIAAPLPADLFATSTHGLGVVHAIELARALGMLPRTLVVLGIEALGFEAGAPPSAEVARAVELAADAVLEEIRAASPAGVAG